MQNICFHQEVYYFDNKTYPPQAIVLVKYIWRCEFKCYPFTNA